MADHIQIGDIAPRARYSADGATTVFAFAFPIFTEDNLEVYVDDNRMTLTSDYAVAGAGDSDGGIVTFTSAPANGTAVTLVRRLTIARTSDFQSSGEFRAKVINDELDFQTAVLQQIEDDLGRTIRLQRTDAASTFELPDQASRAGKALTFDDNGDVSMTAFEDLTTGVVVSSATPLADTLSGSAGTSLAVSAADHAHPLPALADFGVASQAEAEAGVDNTKAMTPLRTAQSIAARTNNADPVARDMAASALAYTMAYNDVSSITGSVGKFWLSDDFKSDNLNIKTNATYSAANDCYSNPGDRLTTASDFIGGTGKVSLAPDGHVLGTAYNWSVYDNTNLISGDFDFSFTWTTRIATTSVTGTAIGFILDSATGSFTDSDTDYGLSGSNIPFKICNTANIVNVYGNNAAETNISVSDGFVIRIYRTGSTFYVETNGSPTRTMTATSAADLRLAIGCNAAYGDVFDNLTFAQTVGNMTLSPTAATLTTADPTDIVGYFVIDPGTAGFDTNGDASSGDDIIGKVSINNGSTWAVGVWTKVGNIGSAGEQLWRLEADVSVQTGSSLIWEITTANSKVVELHECIGLIASY